VANSPVLLIEFNELCPPLMQRFMGRGLLPNFRRFYDQSQVYVTEAVERAPNLEPWIQWITVHTGLTYEEHQIFNIGEGHKLQAPAVWDVLSAAGLRVWVCGSMNTNGEQPVNGALLPDPWTTQFGPQPRELATYFQFVQRQVQEHTNDKVALSAREYLAFATFLVRHGLSRATMAAVARQLIEERRTGRGRWKRAMLLDRMQLDVFKHYWRKLQPEFSTFFSNSTAHFQHMYWRNMEPQLFKVAPGQEEQSEYHDAIERGYREMDRMLGEMMELCGDRATLVFATAISQQPCLVYEERGGKVAYRPRDFSKLLRFAGVEGNPSIAPVMAQYFHARFQDERSAKEGARKLRALQIDGAQAFNVVEEVGSEFMCGCHVYRQLEEGTLLRSAETGASTPFFELFYRIEGIKSGMHHPEGILWIRRPDRAHEVHSEKVPLQHVAPMLLDMFSIKPPATMRAAPLRGFAHLADQKMAAAG
jgi:hypothetical protein